MIFFQYFNKKISAIVVIVKNFPIIFSFLTDQLFFDNILLSSSSFQDFKNLIFWHGDCIYPNYYFFGHLIEHNAYFTTSFFYATIEYLTLYLTKDEEFMFDLFKNHGILSVLLTIILSLFTKYDKRTVAHIVFLILGFLTSNGCMSIRGLYNFFFLKYSSLGFKSFYYLLNDSKLDIDDISRSIVKLALSLIPDGCNLPVNLIVDDTLAEKFGNHFQYVANLHDHAKHNGTEYMHGHCFVCAVIQVPVKNSKGNTLYIRIPYGYRMWVPSENSSKYSKEDNDEQKTKLKIAEELFEIARAEIGTERNIRVIVDSWYPKGEVVHFINEYHNVAGVFNVRRDTTLYDLPPQEEEKRRGRPRKKGKKLSIDNDFDFIDVPNCNYFVAHKMVLTNLFGLDRPVLAMVTRTKEGDSTRLFICTDPDICKVDEDLITDKDYKSIVKTIPSLSYFACYNSRWPIETCFYEQKMFWGLEEYKVRSKAGIERLINLQTLTYSLLSMFPHLNSNLGIFENLSIQERRQKLGVMIEEQFFLSKLTDWLETEKNLSDVQSCKKFLRDLDLYAKTGT